MVTRPLQVRCASTLVGGARLPGKDAQSAGEMNKVGLLSVVASMHRSAPASVVFRDSVVTGSSCMSPATEQAVIQASLAHWLGVVKEYVFSVRLCSHRMCSRVARDFQWRPVCLRMQASDLAVLHMTRGSRAVWELEMRMR